MRKLQLTPPPAGQNGFEITRDAIRISGEAPDAAGLLRVIDESRLFVGSEFAAAMARGAVFAVRARREPQQ